MFKLFIFIYNIKYESFYAKPELIKLPLPVPVKATKQLKVKLKLEHQERRKGTRKIY
jgi:hypothetical protein